MKAEALIGTVLGTCTLQRLIGQGGMGAVFLAQQSRPRRQVAVKVLLPMASLTPNQLDAFLERFRRETDAAASLEHPNIMPVHEYGERGTIAYLVMPYISGGTLRDEMEREGPLPLTKVVNYLEQLAAALDFAHKRGVIHRDIKPANILLTAEGRLLLTDFGLVKIVAEGKAPQMHITGAGAPVGTPDYMAPEQVIGEWVDGRADLYSLGIILYQMVTGTTPFQGETAMQIAAQHLQLPPPSPRMLRPDLPVAAEQVILRSLAKRPAERYANGKELAEAFRAALSGISQVTGAHAALNGATAARLLPPSNGLCSGTMGTGPNFDGDGSLLSRPTGLLSSTTTSSLPAACAERTGGLLSRTGKFPQTTGTLGTARTGGLLSRTGKFPQMTTGRLGTAGTASGVDTVRATEMGGSDTLSATDNAIRTVSSTSGSIPIPLETQLDRKRVSAELNTSGSLTTPRRSTNTVKLPGPVKVVQVPVAGQPGRYVTGLLPANPITPQTPNVEVKKVLLTIVAVLVLLGMAFWFVRSHSNTNQLAKPHTTTYPRNGGTPDVRGTVLAQASATARANIILSDPLATNTNNWLTTPPDVYAFKDGAYHITNHGDKGRATVLQISPFTGLLGYTLTMEEITGNDNTADNSYGMIMRFTQQRMGGNTTTTFYSFEVVNTKGGEYQFWKYDDSKITPDNPSPWKKLWSQPFGTEFHQGHGPQSVNTCKVFMNGANFTITVNGKRIKTLQDGSLTGGTVGMLVNLDGTEIAFKNLLLTRN